MKTTKERKLIDKLGNNWRYKRSTYEDGPPHRNKFLKKKDLEKNPPTILERLFFWEAVSWQEVAWSINDNEIRTCDKDIAEELEDMGTSYKVILV